LVEAIENPLKASRSPVVPESPTEKKLKKSMRNEDGDNTHGGGVLLLTAAA